MITLEKWESLGGGAGGVEEAGRQAGREAERWVGWAGGVGVGGR